jgi:hypothetical protein
LISFGRYRRLITLPHVSPPLRRQVNACPGKKKTRRVGRLVCRKLCSMAGRTASSAAQRAAHLPAGRAMITMIQKITD